MAKKTVFSIIVALILLATALNFVSAAVVETVQYNCSEPYQPIVLNITNVTDSAYARISYFTPTGLKQYAIVTKINSTNYQASIIPDRLGSYNFSTIFTNNTAEALTTKCTVSYPAGWTSRNILNKTKQLSYNFETFSFNPSNNTYYFNHNSDRITINGDAYHLQGYYLYEMFRLTKNYTYLNRLRDYAWRTASCFDYNSYELGTTLNGTCAAGGSVRDDVSPNSLGNTPNNWRALIGMWQYQQAMKEDTMFDYTYNKTDWATQNSKLYRGCDGTTNANFCNRLEDGLRVGADGTVHRRVSNLASYTMYINFSYIKDKYFNNVANVTQLTVAIEYYGDPDNGATALMAGFWNGAAWENPAANATNTKGAWQEGAATTDTSFYNCVTKTDSKTHICRFPVNYTYLSKKYGVDDDGIASANMIIDYSNNKNFSIVRQWFEPYEMLGDTNGNLNTPDFMLNASWLTIQESIDFNPEFSSSSAFRVGNAIDKGHVTGARNQDEMLSTLIGLHLANEKRTDTFSYQYVVAQNHSTWARNNYFTSPTSSVIKILNLTAAPSTYPTIYLDTYLFYRDNNQSGLGAICDVNVTVNGNSSQVVLINMSSDAEEGLYINVLKDVKNYVVEGLNNFTYIPSCAAGETLNASIYFAIGNTNSTGWNGTGYLTGAVYNFSGTENMIRMTTNVSSSYYNFQNLIDNYWGDAVATNGKLAGMWLRGMEENDLSYIDVVYRRHNYEPYPLQFDQHFASQSNYSRKVYSNFTSDWNIYQTYITQQKDFYDSYYSNGTVHTNRQMPIYEIQPLYYVGRIERASGQRFATNYSQFLDSTDKIISDNGLTAFGDLSQGFNYYQFWTATSLLSIYPVDQSFTPTDTDTNNLTIIFGRNGGYAVMNETNMDTWSNYNYSHRWNAQMTVPLNDSNRSNAYFPQIDFSNKCIVVNESSTGFKISISSATSVCVKNINQPVTASFQEIDYTLQSGKTYWLQTKLYVNDTNYFLNYVNFNGTMFITDSQGNFTTDLNNRSYFTNGDTNNTARIKSLSAARITKVGDLSTALFPITGNYNLTVASGDVWEIFNNGAFPIKIRGAGTHIKIGGNNSHIRFKS